MDELPEVVCLCGSTRFWHIFQEVNAQLTLRGYIVVAPGVATSTWYGPASTITLDQKVALDTLHKRKIDLADRVVIINPEGYVGSSTESEIDYAVETGKPVTYLWSDGAWDYSPFEVSDGATTG